MLLVIHVTIRAMGVTVLEITLMIDVKIWAGLIISSIGPNDFFYSARAVQKDEGFFLANYVVRTGLSYSILGYTVYCVAVTTHKTCQTRAHVTQHSGYVTLVRLLVHLWSTVSCRWLQAASHCRGTGHWHQWRKVLAVPASSSLLSDWWWSEIQTDGEREEGGRTT